VTAALDVVVVRVRLIVISACMAQLLLFRKRSSLCIFSTFLIVALDTAAPACQLHPCMWLHASSFVSVALSSWRTRRRTANATHTMLLFSPLVGIFLYKNS
jgi:hypothetical protein